jgi:2',3'-cyclic-nucleotide 2'-phosphodiesterase/3'-nucleotidase/2',3'-cyclic-nucleotide 2'-phosphodiesterase/3'-nucleotidase/5'-nucleotidase
VSVSFASRPAVHLDGYLGETLTPEAIGVGKPWTLHVGGSFADVPAASPYYRFIETLLHNGVTGGCGGASFCPTAEVTREQMSVFVLRTLDPDLDPPACVPGAERFADVPASSAFCRWIEELARRGVVGGCGGANYCPTAAVTREQMSVFLTMTFGLTLYGP